MLYCKQDGTPLIAEVFSLPSDFVSDEKDSDEGEQATVLRNQPIHFDISNPKIPDKQTKRQTQVPTAQPQVNQYAPTHGNIPPQVNSKPNRGCLKYTLILLVGLLIGGGIVLALLGFGYFYMNSHAKDDLNVNTETTVEKTPAKRTDNNSVKKTTDKHSEKNSDVNESSLNGQIIRNSATLRSSPASSGKRIERLPKNDRIEIIKRKSSNSKWYEIECEHGSRGWIDGNLIEFTKRAEGEERE